MGEDRSTKQKCVVQAGSKMSATWDTDAFQNRRSIGHRIHRSICRKSVPPVFQKYFKGMPT